MKHAIALLALLSASAHAQAADSPIGRWRTIDDATGKTKSVVEVYQARDGSLAGRVDGPNPACDKCKGALHGKPIKGMVILWGLKPDAAGKWSGGRVLDPENGKDYKARIELLDGGRKLGMSGCIAFICKSQTWIRQ